MFKFLATLYHSIVGHFTTDQRRTSPKYQINKDHGPNWLKIALLSQRR